MGINLDLMKKKMAAVNNGGGSSNFWKIPKGDSTVRIVPDPDGDPLREFWFHYGVGNQSFLCPKKTEGAHCPVCDFVSKLYDSGSEEDRKLANSIRAKQRFYSPVVVRGEEDQGVRLWSYSKTVYTRLLSLILDKEYGDITDPKTGTDLNLNYGKKQGKLYPEVDVNPQRSVSLLMEDADKAAEFMEQEFDYDNLFSVKTSEQVQQALDSYLNGTSDEEKEQTTAYAATNNMDAVESKFKELLAQ
jgi:hypothetical protein